MRPPSPAVRRRILLVPLVAVFTAALGILMWLDISAPGRDIGESIALGAAFSIFFAVGLTIVLRRSGHPIGWLFLGIAVYAILQAALSGLGERMMAEGVGETLVLVANVGFSWPTLLGTMVVVVPLLFPSGRLPSPRWRWLAWLTGVIMLVATLANTFQRDVCVEYDDGGTCLSRVDNPIGVSWLENLEESMYGAVLFGLLAFCIVAAGTSVVFRYRRARGVERAQLRWFTFSVGLWLGYILVVDILVGDVLGLEAEVSALFPSWLDPFGVLLAFVPISVGLAIMRYRLYDIDRIISRTVAYGIVTASLVATYAGIVFVLRRLLPAQSQLAVAASTLAVAAAFNPLRRRVQSLVDRRFNRTGYDAAAVVDDLSRRIRSEVGLHDLGGGLIEVVAGTMQPASASLWLPPPSREPGV